MSRSITISLLLVAVACGGESSAPDQVDAGDTEADASTGSNDGVLPPLVPQSGVAYVAHYHSGELRSYRTDTAAPVAGPSIDLGQPSHDLILDSQNDRLVVVSDVGRSATIFSIERPSSPGAAIAEPSQLATLSFTDIPRFGAINPYRHRLYVVTADPNQSPLTTMSLHAYDVQDPANPEALDGWPMTIPVTVSFALDPVRDVLFLVELTSDTLHGFDVGLDRFEPLGGQALDLTEQFPQQNQASFQARNLVADVRRNRLIAARSQSALSELIVIEYPADIPTGGARYRDFVALDDLSYVDDGFDVDTPLEERANLLDAYMPAVDEESGAIFLSADAWNGNASMAVLTVFDASAALVAGCNDVPGEGFGCFLRGHNAGTATSYRRTDGAMCVDAANQRVLATSVEVSDETQPGGVYVFNYSADLSVMAPLLPEGGGNLAAGPLPISAVCH